MTIKTGVIYLQKNSFQFYSPYAGRIVEFRFPPEIIRDLDVINGELLENFVKVFVTNSKMTPFNLVIVLAENAYFVKDFILPVPQKTVTPTQPEITKELLQKQADEFIEHVPFDNVVSKIIPLKDGLRVCATNKDFYEAVAVAFEHLGFTVESVIPGLVLGNGLSLRPVMDVPMATIILQKVNAVRQYNLLGQKVFQPQIRQETEEVDEVEIERSQKQKPDRKRLYALTGIFASLILVLVIVYVQSQAPTTSPKQPALANTTSPTQPVSNPVILATAAPVATTATSPSNLQTGTLTVQIINKASSEQVAKTIAGLLETLHFRSVGMQTQSSVGSANTVVSFSANTSQDVRNAVLTIVKKEESNVSVQEKQVGVSDITIVLGE